MSFKPFSSAKNQLSTLEGAKPNVSLARCDFAEACEAAINQQINIEYTISYLYHGMFAYFDRDNVALPGLAEYFRKSSEEERTHAEKLMKYQTLRGGKVALLPLSAPEIMDFSHSTKGDALYAMELALALEKLNYQNLMKLHGAAEQSGDAQMQDFIEGELLQDQVADIKKTAQYVAQLRSIGKGHAVWHFDKEL